MSESEVQPFFDCNNCRETVRTENAKAHSSRCLMLRCLTCGHCVGGTTAEIHRCVPVNIPQAQFKFTATPYICAFFILLTSIFYSSKEAFFGAKLGSLFFDGCLFFSFLAALAFLLGIKTINPETNITNRYANLRTRIFCLLFCLPADFTKLTAVLSLLPPLILVVHTFIVKLFEPKEAPIQCIWLISLLMHAPLIVSLINDMRQKYRLIFHRPRYVQ